MHAYHVTHPQEQTIINSSPWNFVSTKTWFYTIDNKEAEAEKFKYSVAGVLIA